MHDKRIVSSLNSLRLILLFFRSCGEKGLFVISERYRCHHNTRYDKTANPDPSKPHRRTKNTSCPFSMTIKIRRKEHVPDGEKNCTIILDWRHNHPLDSLEVSTFRDMRPETSEKVMNYFDQGLSPGKRYAHILDTLA